MVVQSDSKNVAHTSFESMNISYTGAEHVKIDLQECGISCSGSDKPARLCCFHK